MSQTISIRFRVKIVFVFLIFFAIGYGFTNRFPIFAPKVLPMTVVDDYFGFHPWTIWIYISDYLLIFLPVILVTHADMLKRLAKGFFMNCAIHYPIFFFFPTTIERPPLLEQNATASVFNWVRAMDTPVNCFPSQHVSLCFFIALAFWNYKRKWSIFFLMWAALISLSTLSTKQHYFWDILGGLLVTVITFWIVFRKHGQPHVTLVAPSR